MAGSSTCSEGMLWVSAMRFGGGPGSWEVLWCDGPREGSGMGRRGGDLRWDEGLWGGSVSALDISAALPLGFAGQGGLSACPEQQLPTV